VRQLERSWEFGKVGKNENYGHLKTINGREATETFERYGKFAGRDDVLLLPEISSWD
jgi:hypothetical protein